MLDLGATEGEIFFVKFQGCYALAEWRLGLTSDSEPYKAATEGADKTTPFPHHASGARLFTSLADAEAYLKKLKAAGKNPRLFVVQTSKPFWPTPTSFVNTTGFSSEIDPLMVDITGSKNFATRHWDAKTQEYFWEWMDNSHGPVQQNSAPPGPPTYKYNTYGVIVPRDNAKYLPPEKTPPKEGTFSPGFACRFGGFLGRLLGK